jgi:soluble cytochrome b562
MRLSLLALLLLLAGSVAVCQEKQKDPTSLLDLAKLSEEGHDVAKPAEALSQKVKELKTVMASYKSRARKGIGTGPASPDDGIETKIIALGKQAPSASSLKKEKEKAELVKIGHVNLAVSEMARHYKPKKMREGKGRKDWLQYCDDLKQGADDLLKAVKAGEAKAVQRGAAAMQSACNRCHEDFRD